MREAQSLLPAVLRCTSDPYFARKAQFALLWLLASNRRGAKPTRKHASTRLKAHRSAKSPTTSFFLIRVRALHTATAFFSILGHATASRCRLWNIPCSTGKIPCSSGCNSTTCQFTVNLCYLILGQKAVASTEYSNKAFGCTSTMCIATKAASDGDYVCCNQGVSVALLQIFCVPISYFDCSSERRHALVRVR